MEYPQRRSRDLPSLCRKCRWTDFGSYVKSLCLSLAEIQTTPGGAVTLTCDSEALILDLDVVTALGIVVAELVTNGYDHAFPSGKGSAIVSVRRTAGDRDMATMTISDNGNGFKVNAKTSDTGSVWCGDWSNRFAEP